MVYNEEYYRAKRWHVENPHVYTLFCHRARFLREQRGFTHYSAWALLNALRWHYDVETVGDRFKIPNYMMAFFARKYNSEYGVEFFKTRRSVLDEVEEVSCATKP